jgi:hypothetical protein
MNEQLNQSLCFAHVKDEIYIHQHLVCVLYMLNLLILYMDG